jgi:hypothetical protein
MSLLRDVDTVLQNAGYRVVASASNPAMLFFEDHSLFGVVATYPSVEELLSGWRKTQDAFLQGHAMVLRSAAQKAWNCYTVHVTEEPANSGQRQRLFNIEEDFTSTRKIARGGITTQTDVHHALYPLLPVQNLVQMHTSREVSDLGARLHDWPAPAVKALLGSTKSDDVLELLIGEE